MGKTSEPTGKEANVNVVRNQKDTVFRKLFEGKKELLSLYNAVNGTEYGNPDELEVNTLDNAIYMAMKNDISCVIDMRLNLYEHQSTVNPNMPLRDLFYIAKVLEKMTMEESLYAKKRIMLPAPKFVVFYNGEESQPERRVMKLSDSYLTGKEEISLELVVLQLNINAGFNTELKESCRTLQEYMHYVDKIRHFRKTLPLREAVDRAVRECIREGILKEFLLQNRAEVMQMSIFEYDQEAHMRLVWEEGRQEGREEGRQEGEMAGKKRVAELILNMHRKGYTLEQIADVTEKEMDEIQAIIEGKEPVLL